MQTKKVLNGLSLILLFSCGSGMCASDGFSAIRCGSDIPQALVGRTMRNERIVVIEERHECPARPNGISLGREIRRD